MKRFGYSCHVVLWAMLIVFGAVGCEGEGEEVNPKFMSIQNADALVVAKRADVASNGANNPVARVASGGSDNVLLQVKGDGKLEEVTYTLTYSESNEEGKTIEYTKNPLAVYPAGADHVVVVFGENAINIRAGFLVNTTTGAMYTLEDAGFPELQQRNFKNMPVILTDDAGFLYYLTGYSPTTDYIYHSNVIQVNITDPENITAVVYNPSEETVDNFTVDGAGNMAYSAYLVSDMMSAKSSGWTEYQRVRKANGGVHDLPPNTEEYWVGPNGHLMYVDHNDNEAPLKELTIDAEGNVNTSEFGTATGAGCGAPVSESYVLQFEERMLFAGTDGAICEMDSTDRWPVSIPDLGEINQVMSSDEHYYVAGKKTDGATVLLKVKPADHSYVDVFTPRDYSVYEMSVSSDDQLTVSALREDGAKVLVDFDQDLTMTVLEEENGVVVISLARIN